MPNYFIRNYQTDRLELHFERSFYINLAESVKQSVRASFYFDKKIPAWISKTKLSTGKGVFVPDYLELEDRGSVEKSSSNNSDTPKPEPKSIRFKRPSKSAPKLSDAAYLDAYSRVRHLLDSKTKAAHTFFAAESDDFTDLGRLYDDEDISASWIRHKQEIADWKLEVDSGDKVGDGYAGQGRNFVGRSQKQTADLDIAELAKLVRQELAAEYPGTKFSVTIDRYSMGQSLDVSILSSTFDPFSDDYIKYLTTTETAGKWLDFLRSKYGDFGRGGKIESIYNEKFETFRKKVNKIREQYNFDNSDAMTDYFHVRYYGSVRVEEVALLAQYYPNSPEATRYAKSESQYSAKKAAWDKKAAENKGAYKKWSLVYYTRKTGRPDRKGYLNDGTYLAVIFKSPNGRSAFSSTYDIKLLKPLSELTPEAQERMRNTDKKYISAFLFLHNGVEYVRNDSFRELTGISEKELSPADQQPIAKSTPKPVSTAAPVSKPTVAPQPKAAPATVDPSLAAVKRSEAFGKTAVALLKEANKKFTELQGVNTNTPKRLREANSKRIDAEILSDKGNYYAAIGKAILAGTLPPILKGIGPVRADNDLTLFIIGQANGGGYYDAYRATEPLFKTVKKGDYQEKTLLRYAEKIGLNSMEQVQQAYDALQMISGVVKADPSVAKLRQLIDKWRFSKQPGFFPTPTELGKRVVLAAHIQPGDTINEPSAGLGDLAEIIRELYPSNSLDVGETMYSLREILQLKGFNVTAEDFLLVTTHYDKIIMNPPFENNADIDHVRHAYSLLNPGGRLVSIMGEGAFLGGSIKKRAQFLEWLDEVNAGVEKLPEGSFKSAFSPTGVRTRMVIIDKPGSRPTTDKAKAQAKAKAKLKLLSLQF